MKTKFNYSKTKRRSVGVRCVCTCVPAGQFIQLFVDIVSFEEGKGWQRQQKKPLVGSVVWYPYHRRMWSDDVTVWQRSECEKNGKNMCARVGRACQLNARCHRFVNERVCTLNVAAENLKFHVLRGTEIFVNSRQLVRYIFDNMDDMRPLADCVMLDLNLL